MWHATEDSPWSAVMADSTKLWSGWELAKNANILTHGSLSPQYQRLQGNQDVFKNNAIVKSICL